MASPGPTTPSPKVSYEWRDKGPTSFPASAPRVVTETLATGQANTEVLISKSVILLGLSVTNATSGDALVTFADARTASFSAQNTSGVATTYYSPSFLALPVDADTAVSAPSWVYALVLREGLNVFSDVIVSVSAIYVDLDEATQIESENNQPPNNQKGVPSTNIKGRRKRG